MSNFPFRSRMFKASGIGMQHVPALWVPIRQIGTVTVVEMPPPNFVAPQLGLNLDDQHEFERIGVDFNFNVYPQSGEMMRMTDQFVNFNVAPQTVEVKGTPEYFDNTQDAGRATTIIRE